MKNPASRALKIHEKFRRRQRPHSGPKTGVAQIKRKPITDWVNGKAFSIVHKNNLVYNTCWEDPRLDLEALELTPDDTIAMITSAGCNALDYAIDGPRRIHAIDMNPRQNAVLEMKIAGIRELEHERFFEMFGRGRLADFDQVYRRQLRRHLSPWARRYWDRHSKFFTGRKSFYFCGSSGTVARFCNYYIDKVAKIREDVDLLLEAKTLEEQKVIYDRSLRIAFWTKFMKRFVGSGTTLSMLGVPRQQRQQVELHFGGGIAGFIEDSIETVFTRLPLHDNYFWRVYLKGAYSETCCPRYLTREGFGKLKAGAVDCIDIHTNTIEGFLRSTDEPVSRFILLDHMDWLSTFKYGALVSEWQAIVDRAAPKSRVLFRSGGLKVEFVDPIEVKVNGTRTRLGEMLSYQKEKAERLHAVDRVHTYGSFYIADLAPAG